LADLDLQSDLRRKVAKRNKNGKPIRGSKRKLPVRPEWLAYAARATQYCRDIVAGTIPACKWVKLACQRHLDDLVRSRAKEFEYKFIPARAGKVCAFIERFPHVKGKWALGAQRIHLEPWQLFIVCSIFGWVHKLTGLRRFREARVLVPRKNGKTVLGAGIGNYMFVGDGEPGSEVYTGASNKNQAKEVFSPASKMARRADGFKEWFGITIAKESMYVLDEGSKFEIVIGNPGDGSSPHCFIHDEFHEQPTFAQYDTAKTGAMAREQSLQFVISTAGVDSESPCHELEDDLKKVLDGTFINDRLFGMVFTVDDPERVVKLEDGREVPYWSTIDAVKEANPNFGVSVLAANITAEQKEAVQRASRQNAFKVKNLNIWVNAREAWMNMEKWRACADASLSIEEFLHDPCYEGADLGARIDLTSRCKVFVRDKDGKRHYYLFGRHYVPLDRANDGEHQHYERWLKQDMMVGFPGAEIQLSFVQKDIEEDLNRFDYARLAFDPHQALQMQQELKLRLGQDELQQDRVVEVPQRWQYFDPAMKEIEAAVFSGRLHHNGDPVLTWAIGNVIVKPDANDNVFPRKEDNRVSKIDPATALFTGFYPALAAVPAAAGAIEVW
jgi:phage terminase large subunit-like protein